MSQNIEYAKGNKVIYSKYFTKFKYCDLQLHEKKYQNVFKQKHLYFKFINTNEIPKKKFVFYLKYNKDK